MQSLNFLGNRFRWSPLGLLCTRNRWQNRWSYLRWRTVNISWVLGSQHVIQFWGINIDIGTLKFVEKVHVIMISSAFFTSLSTWRRSSCSWSYDNLSSLNFLFTCDKQRKNIVLVFSVRAHCPGKKMLLIYACVQGALELTECHTFHSILPTYFAQIKYLWNISEKSCSLHLEKWSDFSFGRLLLISGQMDFC